MLSSLNCIQKRLETMASVGLLAQVIGRWGPCPLKYAYNIGTGSQLGKVGAKAPLRSSKN